MIKFSESLTSEVETQLIQIHSDSTCPMQYAENAMKVLIPSLERLKAFFMKYKCSSKIEEIMFFREIKPRLAAKLIYYNEIFNIASNKPVGSKKCMQKYYTAELKKLQAYFDENSDFYKYYRTGNRSLDKQYFIRGQHDIRLTLDSFYLQSDHRFSTSHDYKVARILANESIKAYIESELAVLANPTVKQDFRTTKKIKWTASKVALIELIYALHAETVFNRGSIDLKEIVSHFETMFDIELGQFHRTFLEIRGRKSERAKFLNTITQTLVSRMDDADEN